MLSRVFRTVGQPTATQLDRHLPMINSVSNTLSAYLSEQGQIIKKKALMRWFKGIPELTALSTKVAKDAVDMELAMRSEMTEGISDDDSD